MKLKQRGVLGLGALSFIFTFYSVYLVLHHESSHSVESSPPAAGAALLRDSVPLPDTNELGYGGRGGKPDSLETLRGHLQMMRRDLDESGYNDTLNVQSRSARMKTYVENHPMLQQYAADILDLADMFKDNSNDNIPDKDDLRLHSAVKTNNSRFIGNEIFRNAEPFIKPFPQDMAAQPTVSPFTEKMATTLEKKMSTVKQRRPKKYDKPLMTKLKLNYTWGFEHWWEKWHSHITWQQLYNPNDPALKNTIREMVESPVDDLYQHDGGTQLKLVFFLENDQRVIFKPMRFPRAQETLPDHMYFSDYERHFAEIASFHLDSVLGFHRVPPTAGRFINVTRDVKLLADKKLHKTFFVSPAGNICFHGQCDYYCDTGHAVCGRPELLEGSIQAYIPSSKFAPRKTWRHPWRRSYHKRNKAGWETDMTYCSHVRTTAPYNQGRRLLDLMDLAVFDFLIGNMDRHHYETFESFGNYTFLLHLDNGRAFGKSWKEEMTILAPVAQCCLMRYSTLKKLIRFFRGPTHLSDALRNSLAAEKDIQPVLLEPHYQALDRRVHIILKTIYLCVYRHGVDTVVKRDEF